MSLPEDDFILYSLVNTYLRDNGSLEDFCAHYCADEGEVIRRLERAGFVFDGAQNAFKRK